MRSTCGESRGTSRRVRGKVLRTLVLLAAVSTGCAGLVVACNAAFAEEANGSDASRKEPVAERWERSYQAGYTDSSGHYAGGSEILHLVGHKGRLYAACGYWMDSRNIWYGGADVRTGWGQILRLDDPGGTWGVDLEMGPFHLRPETLESITFTTDGEGNPLGQPVTLLITSTYSPRLTAVDINVFVRNDETGAWSKETIYSGARPKKLGQLSVRDVQVHRDKVTGVDRVFISLGVLGIFSGVYDASLPGGIRWDERPEFGPMETRPLAIIEANGTLLFSTGLRLYERTDGESPTYSVVHDLSDVFPGKVNPAVGGIRGLSAMPNPDGAGESLIFVLAEGGRSRGCIYRLDPDGRGGYARTQEACLEGLMRKYLDGNPVHYVLAGYNDIIPVVDPSTEETVHLVGFESLIGGHRFHTTQRKKTGGYYAGAMYAIRDKKGSYRLSEVNGPSTPDKAVLVAPRAIVVSPFADEDKDVIYVGGYDCNFIPSHDTAWILKTTRRNALREDAPGPVRLPDD